MSPNENAPFIFGGRGKGKSAQNYVNPFYGIPLQYMPLNIDQMLEWADHFLFRFDFYKAALQRVANYFLNTNLSIEGDNERHNDEYRRIFEELKWRLKLSEAGLNLLAHGNLFMSFFQGFTKVMTCPNCGKVYHLDKYDNYTFDIKAGYKSTCVGCKYNGVFKVDDKLDTKADSLRVKFWKPREIRVRYEETMDASEYYWDIPQSYITKVTKKNNKFWSKKVPKPIYESIRDKKMVQFNEKNFLHVKLPTFSSLSIDGKAVPPCMHIFDQLFMLKTLERYTEVICFEDIAPFRVFAMADQIHPASPLQGMASQDWVAAIRNAVTEHRRDPAAYHVVPFTLNYQQLGGQGRQLIPVEVMEHVRQSIINGLNIPIELYNMNLQLQGTGPSLRLFENAWISVVYCYDEILQKWADVIGKVHKLSPVKVSLIKASMADDLEKKSIIGQLMQSNSIARSTMLELYDIDIKDQYRKKIQEEEAMQEVMEEKQQRDALNNRFNATMFSGPQAQGQSGQDMSTMDFSQFQNMDPSQTLEVAEELASGLVDKDGAARRQFLQQIKAHNETLYSAVKQKLEELTRQVKSQAVQQMQGGGQ